MTCSSRLRARPAHVVVGVGVHRRRRVAAVRIHRYRILQREHSAFIIVRPVGVQIHLLRAAIRGLPLHHHALACRPAGRGVLVFVRDAAPLGTVAPGARTCATGAACSVTEQHRRQLAPRRPAVKRRIDGLVVIVIFRLAGIGSLPLLRPVDLSQSVITVVAVIGCLAHGIYALGNMPGCIARVSYGAVLGIGCRQQPVSSGLISEGAGLRAVAARHGHRSQVLERVVACSKSPSCRMGPAQRRNRRSGPRSQPTDWQPDRARSPTSDCHPHPWSWPSSSPPDRSPPWCCRNRHSWYGWRYPPP